MERTQGSVLIGPIPTWSDVQARGPSARARALSDWWIEPQQRLGPSWREPFVAGLIERMAHATLDDLVYAGYEFERSDATWRGTVVRYGCYASIEFCAPRPDAAHRAACIGWMNERTVRAWVDGVALGGSTDEQGRPQANPHAAGWCGERYYFIELAGLFAHPGQDPQSTRLLSTMRGLLICDAVLQRQRVEIPRDDERWPSPHLSFDGAELRLFAARGGGANGAARVMGAPW